MKIKILLIFTTLILFYVQSAFANSISDAKNFFENYIHLCHTYNKTVVDQYDDKAVIKRILIYPDNTNKTRYMPITDYKKKLKFYAPFAKLRGYKNIYHSLKFTPDGKNIRIEGFRQVVYEDYKTPISILVGRNNQGRWVILEEILYTKAINLF